MAEAAESALLREADAAFRSGSLNAALELLREAVAVSPDSLPAATNLCIVALRCADLTTALRAGETAVRLDPHYGPALLNYAAALEKSGNKPAAMDLLQRAVDSDPENAAAWSALGVLYRDGGSLTQGLLAAERSVALQPTTEHLSNFADLAASAGDPELAVDTLLRALAREPDSLLAHSNLLMTLNYLPTASSRRLRDAARAFARTLPKRQAWDPVERSGPLRVGFLSADFCCHPVGWFLARVLPAFDSGRIETRVYCLGTTQDWLTDELRASIPSWTDTSGQDDPTLLATLRNARLDVLVDLSGHTAGGRPWVLAQRVAPLQVAWLGYFGSTGIPNLDAVLLGEAQCDAGAQRCFTETLRPLPGANFCYRPPDYAPDVAPPPVESRGELTFGCFNNPAKLNRDVVNAWAAVLKAVPSSRLLLKARGYDDEGMRRRLIMRFAQAGIPADRIELRGASDHAAMLHEYNEVDIALDPFPFSGALTSCEALWMGVPVLTLAGFRPVSRQTHGILSAIGRSQWSHRTVGELVNCARHLAGDVNALAHHRSNQRQCMQASPLMDGAAAADQLTAELESLYAGLRRRQ